MHTVLTFLFYFVQKDNNMCISLHLTKQYILDIFL